jgi:hypothetical protein
MKLNNADLEKIFSDNLSIEKQTSRPEYDQECVCSLSFSKRDILGYEFSSFFPYMEPEITIYVRTPPIEHSTIQTETHIKYPIDILKLDFCSDGLIDCNPVEQWLEIRLEQNNWKIKTEFQPNIYVQLSDNKTEDDLSFITNVNCDDLNQLLGSPEIKVFSDPFYREEQKYLYYRKSDCYGYELILKIPEHGSGCSITLRGPEKNEDVTTIKIFNVEFDCLTSIACDLKERKLLFCKNDEFTPITIRLDPYFRIFVFDCEYCREARGDW